MKLHLVILSSVLSTLAVPIPGSASASTSRSDCTPVTVLYARGMTEMGGPMGIVVGPPLQKSLERIYGRQNVVVKGIDYLNDPLSAVAGAHATFLASSKMLEASKAVMKDCPRSNVVLVGYGQGAELVHAALKALGPKAASVAAAITFADPVQESGWGELPKRRTKVLCAKGDAVCKGDMIVSPAHLSYGTPGSIDVATSWLEAVVSTTVVPVVEPVPVLVPASAPVSAPSSGGLLSSVFGSSSSSTPSGGSDSTKPSAKGMGGLLGVGVDVPVSVTVNKPQPSPGAGPEAAAKPAGWMESLFGGKSSSAAPAEKPSKGLLGSLLGSGTTTITTEISTNGAGTAVAAGHETSTKPGPN